jgi:hypothetical protein
VHVRAPPLWLSGVGSGGGQRIVNARSARNLSWAVILDTLTAPDPLHKLSADADASVRSCSLPRGEVSKVGGEESAPEN